MFDRSRRTPRIAVTAVAALSLVLTGCSNSGDDAASSSHEGVSDLGSVTLNVIDLIGQTQLEAAGLADTPYKVNYVTAPSSVEMGNAFSGNKIDIGLNSDIGYSTFISKNLPVTIVHSMQRPAKICGIVVAADSPTQTVSDLRGKNLANTVSAGSEIVAYRAFENAGLDLQTDANVINLNAPTEGAAALLSGQADAWLGCGLPISTLIASGDARLLTDGSNPDNPWTAQNYWGVTNSALEDTSKRDAIIDYIGRVDQALEWGNTNIEALSKAQSDLQKSPYEATLNYNKIGPTVGLPITDGVIEGLQGTYDVLTDLGRVEPGVSVADHFTTEYNDRIGATS